MNLKERREAGKKLIEQLFPDQPELVSKKLKDARKLAYNRDSFQQPPECYKDCDDPNCPYTH